ncbi:hypothetical protein PA07A_0900 [Cutibacterium acnes P07A]|nr:hypothetical protein [Cutibacterium acnes P07A]
MFLGFAWFKLELGNSRGKSGLAGLSGNCQPGDAWCDS